MSHGPFSDCVQNASLGYDKEPCNNNVGCAHANGFLVIAEILHVGVLRTCAAKGNIFLAWKSESWLDECLEFGSSSDQSHRSKAFVTRGQVPCWLKTSVNGG